MISDNFKNLIEEVNQCIPVYATHLETLREIIGVQSKATDFLIQIDPETDLEEFNEIEQMNKFNALLTISLLDLMVVCKNMCLAETDWEKIHFIKQGYLVIYETISTYHKHNLELRKIITAKFADYLETLNIINTDLKQFKKDHDYKNVIKVIRHKVAGHIDEDFVLYFDIIAKLDGEKATSMISHFIKILTQLLDLSKSLAAHANTIIQYRDEVLDKRLKEMLDKINGLFAKFEK